MQIQNLLELALRTGKKLLKSFLVMLDQFLTKTPKFFILTVFNKTKTYYNEEQRIKNREHLKNVVSCVIYLAKQGLAFRGHDETTGSLNQGNFIKLIKFKSNDLPALKDR